MSIPASHRDLVDAASVATLITNGADGYPQSTAVWFLTDGDLVRTSLQTSRYKYRNLLRDPHATFFFLDLANPYRTLEIRGDVTLEDDADQAFITRLVHHYGQEPSTFGAPLENRVIVTLTPHRINAFG